MASHSLSTFQLNPCSTSQFVFCNRQKDKIKILHWEHNGFLIYYRRLEKGTFFLHAKQLDEQPQLLLIFSFIYLEK
ncbi:IS66 family insertion sequence element accessory protein TnpB [Sutcliffiella horikoshii]